MQVVAHNLISQFTSRQLNVTTTEKRKSSEKLSSGYRINRSADDAAGLQISEKMRSQIRGLNQASRNIQDGISLCQVADGALNESHSILQRMRELSVQAANDTNQAIDRDAIQSEIDELTKEIDRIANDTNFNDGIYPLNNSDIGDKNNSTANKWQLPNSLTNKQKTLEVAAGGGMIDGVFYPAGSILSVTVVRYVGPGLGEGLKADIFWDSISIGPIKYADLFPINVNEFKSVTLDDMKIDDDGYIYYINKSQKKIYFSIDENDKFGFGYTDNVNNKCLKGISVAGNESSNNVNNSSNIWIQMGANSGQGMFLSLVNATAKGVGITDPALDVTSYDNASTSISRLDNAINKVSSYRSHFGAQQNRLEYAKAVDDNTAENTQYAESRIRDTDMAKEMVNYSKHSILEQAGLSMLAQANQSTQGVLSLLQ